MPRSNSDGHGVAVAAPGVSSEAERGTAPAEMRPLTYHGDVQAPVGGNGSGAPSSVLTSSRGHPLSSGRSTGGDSGPPVTIGSRREYFLGVLSFGVCVCVCRFTLCVLLEDSLYCPRGTTNPRGLVE